jgi:long-chain fatty acid transport protein
MRKARITLALLALGAMLILPLSEAQAGGFAIYEQGARAMGRASAFVASPDDPSAIFYNPAGLALLDGTQIYFGGTIILPSADFAGAAPFPGAGVSETMEGQTFLPPNLYVSHRLNEKVVLGVGVHVPFGLGTKWEDPAAFSGRHLSINAEIQQIAVNPTVAFSVNDRLSLGVGVDVRFSKVMLDRYILAPFLHPVSGQPFDLAVASVESDNATGVGFDFGLLYDINDQWTFGLSYRHGMNIEYEGTAQFEQILTGIPAIDNDPVVLAGLADQDVTTSIEYPYIVTGGLAFHVNDDLVVEGDLQYFGWYTFEQLVIEGLLTGTEVVDEDYDGVFILRFGAEWQKTDELALRCGLLLDQSPTPPKSISPLLPDANRTGITAGVGYDLGNFTVDAAILYMMFADADTDGQHPIYNGVYDNSAFLFGLNIGVPIGR